MLLIGTLPNDSNVIEIIKSLNHRFSDNPNRFFMYWNTDLSIEMPLIPSLVKKSTGIKYYLIQICNGDIALKHYTQIRDYDYLIAEMFFEDENDGFYFTENGIIGV
uniref:Uncharacterized protein n=1 Tax=Panagrolaimus davidi TaxID=227884 RepID=A0A914P666_9BILA